MLRGKSEPLEETPPPYGSKIEGGFPGIDVPFLTEDHPIGIAFYRARESFFMPYHLLQRMRCRAEQLKLTFATCDVVIIGRGLHQIYTQLAAQRVSRIVEQGERYAGVGDALVHVGRIQEIPKQKKKQNPEEGQPEVSST
jgi:hypothetical protein